MHRLSSTYAMGLKIAFDPRPFLVLQVTRVSHASLFIQGGLDFPLFSVSRQLLSLAITTHRVFKFPKRTKHSGANMSSLKWYFDDFKVGQIIEAGSCTVSEKEIIVFVKKFDPQPFHIDKVAAENTIFGG